MKEMDEQQMTLDILASCGGNRTEAARVLGINRGTLQRRLKRYRQSTGTFTKRIKPAVKPQELNNGYKVLAIGDTHLPFMHKHYLDFLQRVRDYFRCDLVVHMGDEVDNHAISFHTSEPEAFSQTEEGELAAKGLRKMMEVFPDMHLMEGNHTALPARRAKEGGVPLRYMKTHKEAWGAPEGWHWHEALLVDGVRYVHGTGFSGKTAHIRAAESSRVSTVIGHIHAHAGCGFLASQKDLIFGMNVGCGISVDTYAFHYAKAMPQRPVMSCGVVLNGEQPIVVRMNQKGRMSFDAS